jgi:Leucine-rich repeat (LRR) protein
LKGLTNLTYLDLSHTRVSDAGLVHLKGLTNLTRLDLAGMRVSDAGLVHLKGLTNLTYLDLSHTRVSDAGLVHLKGLTNLAQLDLSRTRVSDAGLRDLVNLPLGIIHLDNSRVSADGFASLRSAFPRAEVTGEAKPSLAEDLLAAGATLRIRAGEGKEDRPVRKIADLPRVPFLVRRADCTDVKKSPGDLLARLSQPREHEFERLEALDLSGCAIDNLGFAPPLQRLQELNVSRTAVADAALQALEGLPSLRNLYLSQTRVTWRGMGHLAKVPKLAELSLAGCTFSDTGLKHLAGMSNLTQLDLTGTQVTPNGVAALTKALPKCRILSGPAAKRPPS